MYILHWGQRGITYRAYKAYVWSLHDNSPPEIMEAQRGPTKTTVLLKGLDVIAR